MDIPIDRIKGLSKLERIVLKAYNDLSASYKSKIFFSWRLDCPEANKELLRWDPLIADDLPDWQKFFRTCLREHFIPYVAEAMLKIERKPFNLGRYW